jgi:hypothetical protein
VKEISLQAVHAKNMAALRLSLDQSKNDFEREKHTQLALSGRITEKLESERDELAKRSSQLICKSSIRNLTRANSIRLQPCIDSQGISTQHCKNDHNCGFHRIRWAGFVLLHGDDIRVSGVALLCKFC